jgi:hypothetical protein
MGTTPNLDLPYPEDANAPDGPGQIQALAEAMDEAIVFGIATETTAYDGHANIGAVPTGYHLISCQVAQETVFPYFIMLLGGDEIHVARSDTGADLSSETVDFAWIAVKD